MKLTPPQAEVARDPHRFRVLVAGRRFGKTVLAVEEMLGYAVAKDEREVCYIAPTYQQARDIAWAYLLKRCEPVIVARNESRLELTVKNATGGTSKIKLRSWDAVDTLRGQAFDFLVLDEVASYSGFWEGWREVLMPTLADRKGHALFIGTPKGFNHFYELSNEQEDRERGPAWRTFRFTTYDNPHIPREEIDAQRSQLPPDTFAQEFMADFRKAEGLVYPEFDRQRHVTESCPSQEQVARRIVGLDFGFTNPTAALLILETRDGRFHVAREWVRPGRTNPEVVEQVRAMRPDACYPDPAEPDRIEELSRAGVPCREVNKDVPFGIDRVRRAIVTNRLTIDPSCVVTLSEIEQYRWKESMDERNAKEEPEKHNDHCMDALRYAVAMASEDVPFDTGEVSLYGGDWL